MAEPLLEISGLRTGFDTHDGTVPAVDGVDLTVHAGKTLCVVGESGCGKSVTARSILRLIEPPGRIEAGTITWHGDDEPFDVLALPRDDERLQKLRGGDIGMIFQEPASSLLPVRTVGAQLIEAIRIHTGMDKKAARKRAVELLAQVGIPNPDQRVDAYPFQLSGGMCQRIMIAIALCADPALLIADEPTTALDVTTQARILDLLRNLQAEHHMAVMFITHDLGVVAELADEVAVMYLGKVVERATVEELFADPKHPYTKQLLESVPVLGRDRGRDLPTIPGAVPNPLHRPKGCSFHPRCAEAIPGRCDIDEPPEVVFDGGRTAQCVLYDDGQGGPA
ncbi:ABC transporter ATP-binding protein [Glycomyces sp. TRM65418]|uniref:ABC transporter ATP-binding protein n=1 Tax=Glycomyces sp. TRM65418 TaxID=2867006 RepID=UPI001CE57E59|nr:ABC transporter ATP-binding protein [Glycomyces sp. TRM65418]MCC3765425.1 ABC transporter ATP-binding protein [Glycomyces sp. TRM65418]QZD55035.1 ABC transporter ATP-binding protein [Glycomyces sp. TRM65418]